MSSADILRPAGCIAPDAHVESMRSTIESSLCFQPVLIVPDNWLPTAENINALPSPIRSYICDLETRCDPAGIVRENVLTKDENRQLRAYIESIT